MITSSGAAHVVRALEENGVSTLFVLPGIQLDPLFDALYPHQDRFRIIQTRHEQATTYMAYGYARSAGKLGVSVVVPGPGVLNALSGLSTAYATNTPVLLLAGQIPSHTIGREYGMLHELPDQLAMLRGVTKWAKRAQNPDEVSQLFNEAVCAARSGRGRPVALELPVDILAAQATAPGSTGGARPSRPDIDGEAVARAARLLESASFPVLFTGGGALDASEQVRELVSRFRLPVVQSINGRGVVSDDSPFSHTEVSGFELWKRADVVLAVGTRLHHQLLYWGVDDDLKVIRVDVDPAQHDLVHPAHLAITGDAGQVLERLLGELNGQNRAAGIEDISRRLRDEARASLDGLEVQAQLGEVIRDEMPRDSIVVSEYTQMGYFLNYWLPVHEPRSYITPGYQGTLGYGFATALGAQVAHPERRVLSINGDGGFMFNVQELATAAKYQIPLIAVVFNDGAFGNVRWIQRQQYGGREIASDLHNPDFVALAQSFGVTGLRARDAAGFRAALREALESSGPVLIEVEMPEVEPVWPLVPRYARARGGE